MLLWDAARIILNVISYNVKIIGIPDEVNLVNLIKNKAMNVKKIFEGKLEYMLDNTSNLSCKELESFCENYLKVLYWRIEGGSTPKAVFLKFFEANATDYGLEVDNKLHFTLKKKGFHDIQLKTELVDSAHEYFFRDLHDLNLTTKTLIKRAYAR